MESVRKINSMKIKPRKVKIMEIKASWGPLKVWGPRGSISVGLIIVSIHD